MLLLSLTSGSHRRGQRIVQAAGEERRAGQADGEAARQDGHRRLQGQGAAQGAAAGQRKGDDERSSKHLFFWGGGPRSGVSATNERLLLLLFQLRQSQTELDKVQEAMDNFSKMK